MPSEDSRILNLLPPRPLPRPRPLPLPVIVVGGNRGLMSNREGIGRTRRGSTTETSGNLDEKASFGGAALLRRRVVMMDGARTSAATALALRRGDPVAFERIECRLGSSGRALHGQIHGRARHRAPAERQVGALAAADVAGHRLCSRTHRCHRAEVASRCETRGRGDWWWCVGWRFKLECG